MIHLTRDNGYVHTYSREIGSFYPHVYVLHSLDTYRPYYSVTYVGPFFLIHNKFTHSLEKKRRKKSSSSFLYFFCFFFAN